MADGIPSTRDCVDQWEQRKPHVNILIRGEPCSNMETKEGGGNWWVASAQIPLTVGLIPTAKLLVDNSL